MIPVQSGLQTGNLLFEIGNRLAALDEAENRTKTQHADRLRQLTSQGVQRRKNMRDSLAARGMIHSGVGNDQQTRLQNTIQDTQARMEQAMTDRLANIARERVGLETQFNINSLIPR